MYLARDALSRRTAGCKVGLDYGFHFVGQPRIIDLAVGHDQGKVVCQDFFWVDDVSGVPTNFSLKICRLRRVVDRFVFLEFRNPARWSLFDLHQFEGKVREQIRRPIDLVILFGDQHRRNVN